jgi:uncharacterized protein (TIGR00255 family)
MTGFGSGRAESGLLQIQVELRSVNNRFFDFQSRLPKELSFVEKDIVERLRRDVGRGRVTAQVQLERAGAAAGPNLDAKVLRGYLDLLDKVETEGGFKERGSAAQFLSLPELLGNAEEAADQETMGKLTLAALDEAMAGLIAMKQAEGGAMAADLTARLATLDGCLARIEARAPEAKTTLHDNLKARLDELLGDVGIDPQRLAQEAALLVDRGDVTEEMVRLRSHLDQFAKVLNEGGEISKKLGFLLQEILRETNTIGSKTQSLDLIQEVLSVKEELEKIREQIQNLE